MLEARAAVFDPEIPIPGQFAGPQEVNSDLFGKYVRAIYIYFIWTVGIVATGMVIYAGVKWVAAAGDQGRIRDARDMINNAIIGVIIGLTSVVLLNLLSPGFTTLKIPVTNTVSGSPYIFNNGCIQNLVCPEGMSRTYAIFCAGGAFPAGGAVYVDADVAYCDNNGAHRGICCRNTDTNQCTGISGTDAKSFSSTCFANAEAVLKKTSTTGCNDTTACGQRKDLPNNKQCVGTYCPTGQLCADKNGTVPAGCIDPSTETNSLARKEISAQGICTLPNNATKFYEYYTSGAACGKSVQAFDPALKTQVQAFGTNGGCPAGQYCGTAPIGVGSNNECYIVAPRTICKPTSNYPIVE